MSNIPEEDKKINPIKRLLNRGAKHKKSILAAKTISADHHKISPQDIPSNALQILYRLQDAEFEGYLVGGGIRDLLLNHHPKDFDIATNASLNQVKKLFRNCRLIGRRFRIAHVYFHREIIEVSTFPESESKKTVIGKIEDDAKRRDFTINALYFDPISHNVFDFFTGFEDLKNKTIRMIGDAKARYSEDPVRMLRAARFAAKLNFKIEPETEKPIRKYAKLLNEISPARLFDEVIKLFYTGHALASLKELRRLGLLGTLFPATDQLFDSPTKNFAELLVTHMLKNTDDRIAIGKPVAPTFLFAIFLWPPLIETIRSEIESGTSQNLAYYQAVKTVLRDQAKRTMMPKRISTGLQEIWALQYRLEQRRPKYILETLEHPRFRAAYDLLLLRSESGEDLDSIASWWTEIQTVNETEQLEMVKNLTRKKRESTRKK